MIRECCFHRCLATVHKCSSSDGNSCRQQTGRHCQLSYIWLVPAHWRCNCSSSCDTMKCCHLSIDCDSTQSNSCLYDSFKPQWKSTVRLTQRAYRIRICRSISAGSHPKDAKTQPDSKRDLFGYSPIFTGEDFPKSAGTRNSRWRSENDKNHFRVSWPPVNRNTRRRNAETYWYT